MVATLLPPPTQRYFTLSGTTPLAGGKIYTYVAGTTTPLITYKDAAATQSHTNPIIIEDDGYVQIWGIGTYKIRIFDANDIFQTEGDNIVGSVTISNYFQDTGSPNHYIITPVPPFTAYTDGMTILVKAANPNPAGASDINVNGLGVVNIVYPNNTPLIPNQITAGEILQLIYNAGNGNFQLMGQTSSFSIIRISDSIQDVNGNVLIEFDNPTGEMRTTGFRITSGFKDSNGNEILSLAEQASAVNEITIGNGPTGSYPFISATGGNADIGINFQPKGSANIGILGTSVSAGQLAFYENTANGSNKVTLKGANSIASDVTFTLPDEDSTSGYSLTTNGAGLLQFINPIRPAFRAYRISTAPVSGLGFSKIIFDIEDFDTNNCYDPILSRFTPNIPGYYYVSSFVNFSVSTVSGNITASINLYKNSISIGSASAANGGTNAIISVHTPNTVFMNGTTDFVEIFSVFSNGSATVNLNPVGQYNCFFEAHLFRTQ